ncbi:hypothetical protein BDZ94DRAFT_1316425 [Collybia nuda]|uniref:Uncharacterized protein n=1 Tax=Collybia nuda TaxID=64659 RepID=A0A9P5XT73_9AGAR|nr:hypothetical protein BDZ94DRAFT_1316425 [Collybia nuda]
MRKRAKAKNPKRELSPDEGVVRSASVTDEHFSDSPSQERHASRSTLSTESKTDTVYLEDVMDEHKRPIALVCEVMNPEYQDPMLVSQYIGLPKLLKGVLLSWSTAQGPGYFPFSFWPEDVPTLDMTAALSCMSFVQKGDYVNLARVDPILLGSKSIPAKSPRAIICIGQTPAICVMPVSTVVSNIIQPNSKNYKLLSGYPHGQEIDRVAGVLRMVFGHTKFNAPLAMNVLTFQTLPPKATSSPIRNFRGFGSSSTGSSSRASGSYFSSVRVYDAREVDFNLTRDIDKMESLPLFEEEIPAGSFAVVGHSISSYEDSVPGEYGLSFNILWVILLGCP